MSVAYFNHVTFALPVERFRFDSLASLEERLPVVTEFVLRLIHIVGQASPATVREYFGFTDEEAVSVLESMTQQGLLTLNGESVELTTFALTRFQESGTDYPLFSRVERREDILDFDLFTFSPLLPKITSRSVSENDVRLEPRPEQVSQSLERGRQSYREHFSSIVAHGRKRVSRDKVFGLYSVKDAESRGRFFAPLEVALGIDNNGELVRDMSAPFLKGSASDDLEDQLREQVSERLAQVPRDDLDHQALHEFVQIFDDQVIGRFLTGRVFDLRGYLAEVFVSRTARYQRGVEPVFGNLYMGPNADRLKDMVAERRRPDQPSGQLLAPLIWLKPGYEMWGRGVAFASTLQDLNAQLNPGGDDVHFIAQLQTGVNPSAFAPTKVPGLKNLHLAKVDGTMAPELGDCAEICLYPTGFVYALFHLPIPGAPHLRAPVGFLSTLPSHLDSAHRLLRRMIFERRYGGKVRWGAGDSSAPPIPWHDALPALNLL